MIKFLFKLETLNVINHQKVQVFIFIKNVLLIKIVGIVIDKIILRLAK